MCLLYLLSEDLTTDHVKLESLYIYPMFNWNLYLAFGAWASWAPHLVCAVENLWIRLKEIWNRRWYPL